MPLPDAFDSAETSALLRRLDGLTAETRPLWGRMDAAQMCAHCCTPYEQIRGERGGGPLMVRLFGRLFFKEAVVGERPFKSNLPTPKSFRIADGRDLTRERGRLAAFIREIHGQGRGAFEGRIHPVFGPLAAGEWSNLLWKHLDHHFRQFGV